MFEQRLRRAQDNNLGVTYDPSIQSLFRTLSLTHPQLLSRIERIEEERSYYQALQTKQAQTVDMRKRLEELERQHLQKLEEQRAEQEMLQKIQLEQKLKVGQPTGCCCAAAPVLLYLPVSRPFPQLMEQQEREKEQYRLAMQEKQRQARAEQERIEIESMRQRQQVGWGETHQRNPLC